MAGLVGLLIIAGFIYLIYKGAKEVANSKKPHLYRGPGSIHVSMARPLIERNNAIIQKHLKAFIDEKNFEIDSQIISCIKEIAYKEGRYNLAPKEPLYQWQARKDVPEFWLVLKDYIKDQLEEEYQNYLKNYELEKRLQEQKVKEKQAKEKELREQQQFFHKNSDLINKFLEIAERKVSIIDDYGDENWDCLPKEIDICIEKIAKRNGVTNDVIKDFKKGNTWRLDQEYKFLKDELNKVFRDYHNSQKAKHSSTFDINNLNGIDFEIYIAKILKESGYEDVRGTPATGDQGADLITIKDGRTIVIQAKRYQGLVGNKAVQEVLGAINYYNGDEGWVVTNSSFTSSAKELAQKSNVKLIDGRALSNFKTYT